MLEADNRNSTNRAEELQRLFQNEQEAGTYWEQRAMLAERINDASIDRILAIDVQSRIIVWNRMCEVITGLPRETVLGKKLEEVFPGIETVVLVMEAIQMALKGYKVFVASPQSAYMDPHAELHFVPLKDEAGQVIGVLNIVHDVAHRVKMETELKRLNRSLSQANKELKLKNEELLQFAYSTHHDLKEPLRKIHNFADLILHNDLKVLPPSTRLNLERILGAVHKTNSLIDDLHVFLEIEDAARRLANVNLNTLLPKVLKSLAPVTPATAEIFVGNLPVVRGYPKLLSLLLRHLLDNALKFQAPRNTPQIRVRCKIVSGASIRQIDAAPEAQYARITISDNGIGFERQYSKTVFRLFQRLNNVGSYPGNGVGLAICRKIAGLHHGYLYAESKPGQGSAFHCFLPLDIKSGDYQTEASK